MQNWSRVKQLQDEYNQGFTVGSAQRENEVYLDSIAGKWNTLKENMKGLLTNNVSTDFIKGLLDGLNTLVTTIDKVTSKLGTIGTGGALIGIMSFIKQMSNFSSIMKGESSAFSGMGKAISSMFSAFNSGGVKGGLSSIVTGFKSITTGAGLAKVATIAFNAALSAIGWGLLIAGISAAIKWWDEYHVTTEEAVESAQQAQEAARNEISSLNSQKTSLSQIADEYDQLSRKTSLTADEHERLRELRQQIAEQAPDLVAG